MPLELKAKLSLDNRTFTQGMNFSKQQVMAWSNVLKQHSEKTAETMRSRFAGAFAVLSAVAAAAGLSIKKSIDQGQHIQDLSEKLGIPAEKLQAWGFAAEQSGASIDDVAMGFQKLAVNSTAALDGNEEIVASFKEMGLSIEDIQRMTLEQRFEAVGKAIQNTTIDARVLANVVKLLGKGGTSLIPAFKSGKFEAGKVFASSDSTVENLDEMGDRIKEVSSVFGKGARAFAALFTKPIRLLTGGGWNAPARGGLSQAEKETIAGENSEESEAQKKKAQEIRENMAQDEAEKAEAQKRLLDTVNKSGRDLIYARLKTDEERKAFLQEELDALLKETRDFSTPHARERGLQAAAEANAKQAEIEAIDRNNKVNDNLTPSNSLRSVGNFLGSRDDRPLNELREIKRLLSAMERKPLEIGI